MNSKRISAVAAISSVLCGVGLCAPSIVGVWQREIDEFYNICRTELSFLGDGACVQTITFIPKDRTVSATSLRTVGRWILHGETLDIYVPNTPPIGVTDAPPEKRLRWRVLNISTKALTIKSIGENPIEMQLKRIEPNQAAEPTRTTVTPPASAGDRTSGARGSP